jgi:hypothetical protein
VCRCEAKRIRMKFQGLAHSGHCSGKGAIREFEAGAGKGRALGDL